MWAVVCATTTRMMTVTVVRSRLFHIWPLFVVDNYDPPPKNSAPEEPEHLRTSSPTSTVLLASLRGLSQVDGYGTG
jgi:hypothetical protein